MLLEPRPLTGSSSSSSSSSSILLTCISQSHTVLDPESRVSGSTSLPLSCLAFLLSCFFLVLPCLALPSLLLTSQPCRRLL